MICGCIVEHCHPEPVSGSLFYDSETRDAESSSA